MRGQLGDKQQTPLHTHTHTHNPNTLTGSWQIKSSNIMHDKIKNTNDKSSQRAQPKSAAKERKEKVNREERERVWEWEREREREQAVKSALW